MVKLSLLVSVGALGAALALPISEDVEASERELQLRQGLLLEAILGQIGSALVPVFGAVFGPILTNLFSGIAEAFNNGLNPAAAKPSKGESAGSEDSSDLVVRISPDSPLYALLVAHQQTDKDGLPSVGPQATLAAPAHKPTTFGSKFAVAFHASTSDSAPVIVYDRDSDDVDISDDVEDVEEKHTHVKRYPQRVRTEAEYA